MNTLNKTLSFLQFLHDFQNVERVIPVPGKDRYENDAEHSYTFALLAWYLVDVLSPKLNKDLIIKYALVHDLVEVYAGDTYLFTEDSAYKKSQKEREARALEKIKEVFPEFKELHTCIEEYEKLETPESRYVYALDKVIPVLTIYLDSKNKTSLFKKKKITFEMMLEQKDYKISLSPEVEVLWKELKEFLREKKTEIFMESEHTIF